MAHRISEVAKLTLVTIVGTRPQFVKAAAMSRAIATYNTARGDPADMVREIIVHTGQHYDHAMSRVFFDELGIPEPDLNLGVGSGSHGVQTARMLEAIENALTSHEHDAVVVYGDTNSTLAGALAAAKLHIPVIHVEAGLRSFNKRMPEEVNRILTDHVSSVLLCPTRAAVSNLQKESITDGVHLVGDVMYDSTLHYQSMINGKTDALASHKIEPLSYLLATVHRAENTDKRSKLSAIFESLGEMASKTPVVVVLHPRTKKKIEDFNVNIAENIKLIDPVSYLSMLQLQLNALGIVTDSGGIQKEAFFLGKPCLTIREETEWIETVDLQANTLAGSDGNTIHRWHANLINGRLQPSKNAMPYGEGNATTKILDIVLASFCKPD